MRRSAAGLVAPRPPAHAPLRGGRPRPEVRLPSGAVLRGSVSCAIVPDAPPLRPLLIVTPHASGHVPQDVLGEMLGEARRDLDARRARLARLFEQGDPYTDVIFDLPDAHALHATVSRFVVDLNRRRDQRGPNGVVKLTDFDGTPLYEHGAAPDDARVEERLRRYWDPFHAEVGRTIRRHRVELLIDGHSMTPVGPSLGPDGGAVRPALTLMTGGDEDGEPAGDRPPTVAPGLARALRDTADRAFAPVLREAEGEAPPHAVLNRPWSDDEVVYASAPAAGIPAFGLEINRALYLAPGEDGERPRFERIRELNACFAAFATEALALVRARRAPRNP
jgi:N-formylglutamate amidohydrolase